MRRRIGMAATVLWAVLSFGARERPGVVWWSAPVNPGERVLVHGGAWGTNPVVEVTFLRNGRAGAPRPAEEAEFKRARRVCPEKVTETGVVFELPAEAEAGLAACRVVAEGAASEPFVVNEPAVWWVHGDLGAEASPGGWVRFFGRCLDRGGRARAVLTDGAGKRIELRLAKRDVWSLDAPLEADVKPGRYVAHVHNGCGGRDGWRRAGEVTVRPYAEVWKDKRFDVTAFGAVANDGLDDTLALQAALAMAATNGGGTVYLPRGRFQCQATLQIPPQTLLRGESRETTQLYWPDCEEPPEALIEGSQAFGIQDLFIHSGKYRSGIVCKNDLAGRHALASSSETLSRDITIRRVTFKLIIDQYLLKNTAEYEKRAYLRGNGIVIRNARFVRIEDCDIYCSKEGSSTLFFVVSGEYVRMANCRINGSGWAVVGGDKVIFEKNDAYNCTYSISSVSRNLYWGENRQHDLFTNNREAITHDGARVAFRGTVGAACEGTRMRLDFGDGKPAFSGGPAFWVGHDVQIIGGRGAGQTRTVTSITNGVEVTIDRPWTIRPDATSRFVVAAERRRLLYVDNDTEDSSIAIQLYGGLTEGVLARNRSARSGGFRGFGMVYHSIIPLWFVQYFENEVTEGNSYRGPANQVPPMDSGIDIADHGNNLTLTRSCVIRRCSVHNNGWIGMASDNGVVENCTVRHSDTGVRAAGKHAGTLVLANNRFEQVVEPLDAPVRDRARMHPAERLLALLGGAETAAGTGAPQAWAPIRRRLDACAAAMRADDAETDALVRDAWLEALRALGPTAPGGRPWDAAVVRSLLGASVGVRPWDAEVTQAVADSRSRSFTLPVVVSTAPAAPKMTCRIEPLALSGWTLGEGGERPFDAAGRTVCALPATSPEGFKGMGALPLTCEWRGEGWRVRSRHPAALLAENRLTQWIMAAPFQGGVSNLNAAASWRVMTEANVHGQMNLGAVTGAVACAALRVTRPTAVTFHFSGPIRLFVGTVRVGTDLSRGTWGSVVLQAGDHPVVALPNPDKKGGGAFKVSCRVAENCLPGEVQVLPAAEVLRLRETLFAR